MPIDPEFQKNREKVGEEEGIAIWGPNKARYSWNLRSD